MGSSREQDGGKGAVVSGRLQSGLLLLSVSHSLVYFLVGLEVWQILQIPDLTNVPLIVVRVLATAGMAVGLGLLLGRIRVGWTACLVSQAVLLASSLLHAALLVSHPEYPKIMPLLGLFFQVAAFRSLFVRALVVFLGPQRILRWFRDRRFAASIDARFSRQNARGTNEEEEHPCWISNLSLTGCQFFSTCELNGGEILVMKFSHPSFLEVLVEVNGPSGGSPGRRHDDPSSLPYRYSGAFAQSLSDADFNRILKAGPQHASRPLRAS